MGVSNADPRGNRPRLADLMTWTNGSRERRVAAEALEAATAILDAGEGLSRWALAHA